jgi:hypothetical protein
VNFEIVGTIEHIETIAAGPSVKLQAYLRKVHGPGRWRKLKGAATVRLPSGRLRQVELHWYEAHGIGRRDFKIKSYLDKEQ